MTTGPGKDDTAADGAGGGATQADVDRPSRSKQFGSVMTEIFTPILPPLIGAGIIQGLLTIATSVGVLDEQSTEYHVLNTIGSAVFFFLPFLLAVSSARAFDTNPYGAIGITALLLHPNTTAIMASPDPVDFLGIPITHTQYTSSVVPVILIVWVQAMVGRFARRKLPPILHTVLVPPLVMLVVGVLSLLVLGPAGNLVGTLLGAVVEWLSGVGPWLVPTLIGAFGALLISVGASFTLFPLALSAVAAQGYNTVYGPGFLAVNLSLCGMSLAVMQKTKNKAYKGYCGSAALTALLGVSQPSLYGIAVPLGKPLVATCLGGLAGGLVAGLSGFRVYGFLPSGIAALPAFVPPEGGANLVWGIGVMVVALAGGYLATRLLGFSQPSAETIAGILGEDADPVSSGDDGEAERADTDEHDARSTTDATTPDPGTPTSDRGARRPGSER
ncbi:PTS system, beta-glucoside-specific IIABC component [Modestobacter italicus]|uniref:PTS system, beta-glucoside-specific IIABC component n=1 Tax=Modestobacter italicus (strain DSM 44449 / CECT 9708 / BC 501) TaxID=2732864 RepID=I4EYI0_MODI5|nr:PTS transporter subunit EIIC [Modestobacter marinus]CCH88443.1 PTS system, beta-glucoside-specific IIABC component [Modestobacter marinus]